MLALSLALAAQAAPDLSGWHAALAKGDVAAASAFLAPGATIKTYHYGSVVDASIQDLVGRFSKCTLKQVGRGVGWAHKDVLAAEFDCPEAYDWTMEYVISGGKIAEIKYFAEAVSPPAPPPPPGSN
jgi:hypothetical protein